ncbi:hypothetical protein, variant [Phytophthora nicotianae P10297]|uniref:HTH CENPB-type domain-containing protein n=1 Tax=Phytophthora nicotianae P10297 TaxID=1317064 RepID=W2Z5H2_PHYNI|nr:hypothetical protein F442_10780 [Phytophthora nicotianae P10297]ETP42305.1 hypothetical protein, variant [Phytophthora nicotianae P10297]
MKAPSAEEVLALVNAATGPDGTLDPTMEHLLMQMQEQHALNQAQLRAQEQTQRPPSELKSNVSELPKTIKSDNSHGTASTVMDLMPLSAAAVAIGSPTNSALERATSAVEVASGPAPATPGPPSATSTVPATLTSKAMTRKSIPLSMKKEAIQWIMGPGKGIPSRAEKHFGALNWDVSASSFRKWWKNRDKILGDSGGKKRISGGGRKPYLEDSEEKLLVVVIQERAKKDRVTRKWIAKTAQHMFQRSDSTFKASENWVTKFIRRNGLTLKRSYVTYEPQQTKLEPQHQTSTSGATTTTGTNIVV